MVKVIRYRSLGPIYITGQLRKTGRQIAYARTVPIIADTVGSEYHNVRIRCAGTHDVEGAFEGLKARTARGACRTHVHVAVVANAGHGFVGGFVNYVGTVGKIRGNVRPQSVGVGFVILRDFVVRIDDYIHALC